eukprot:XP_001705490.1 Hypothetical protein GL50803_19508 [Giardia lamblia ATCC 50803]
MYSKTKIISRVVQIERLGCVMMYRRAFFIPAVIASIPLWICASSLLASPSSSVCASTVSCITPVSRRICRVFCSRSATSTSWETSLWEEERRRFLGPFTSIYFWRPSAKSSTIFRPFGEMWRPLSPAMRSFWPRN